MKKLDRRAIARRNQKLLPLLAALVSLVGVATANADDLPEPLTHTSETEPYDIDVPAPAGEPTADFSANIDPEPYINACSDCAPTKFMRFRGGATYYEVPVESKMGGSYALDMAVPLFRSVGAYASGSLNHISGATQFLGTVGVYKQASVCPTDVFNRISYGVMFDQFTDTRFDELYLTQFRFLIGYSLNANTAIGVRHADPAHKDRRVLTTGPIGFVSATFRTSQTTEAFLAHRFGCNMVTATYGYRDDLNTPVYSVEGRRRMNDRMTAIAEITYEEDGLWATMIGFELQLGPSNSCCCDSYARKSSSMVEQVVMASRDVVRGQESGDGFFGNLGNILFGDGNTSGSGPWNDPTMGGIFNYDASDFWERVLFDFARDMGAPPFGETGNGEGDDNEEDFPDVDEPQ